MPNLFPVRYPCWLRAAAGSSDAFRLVQFSAGFSTALESQVSKVGTFGKLENPDRLYPSYTSSLMNVNQFINDLALHICKKMLLKCRSGKH